MFVDNFGFKCKIYAPQHSDLTNKGRKMFNVGKNSKF